MQASKIKVGQTYAVRDENGGGKLVRFTVTAVVTRRINNHNNPHDYESHVEGYIVEQRVPGENPSIIKRSVDAVLGPYEEHVELLQRKQAEVAEQKRKDEHEKERALLLRRLLYELIDMPPLDDDRNHKQLIRYDFGSVEIRKEGIEPMIAVLMHTIATKRNEK